MYLVQGKSTGSLSKEDIKNLYYKMSDTIRDFNDGTYSSYSDQLKTAYLNSYDDLSDEKNIELSERDRCFPISAPFRSDSNNIMKRNSYL